MPKCKHCESTNVKKITDVLKKGSKRTKYRCNECGKGFEE